MTETCFFLEPKKDFKRKPAHPSAEAYFYLLGGGGGEGGAKKSSITKIPSRGLE